MVGNWHASALHAMKAKAGRQKEKKAFLACNGKLMRLWLLLGEFHLSRELSEPGFPRRSTILASPEFDDAVPATRAVLLVRRVE